MRRPLVPLLSLTMALALTPASPASASEPCAVGRAGVTYDNVQAAINNARSGDTLTVFSMCGPENITIDRDLSIAGFEGFVGGLSGTITVTPGMTATLRELTLQGIVTNSGTLTLRRDEGSIRVEEGTAPATTVLQEDHLTDSAVNTSVVRVGLTTFDGTVNAYSVSGKWVTVARSTITGATPSADYDSGAIYAGSRLHVIGSTIAGNIDIEGASSGIESDDPHNRVTVSSSILFNNSPADCEGVIQSGGYNIVGNLGNGQCQFHAQPTDQIGVDPLLGPLTREGVLPLQPGSPAIDAIPVGTVAANRSHTPLCKPGSRDERWVIRPQGAGCDIGAAESF